MKTIKYRGQDIEVEDWANYVAMDNDGSITQFENEPIPGESDEWYSPTGYVLYVDKNIKDWRESLMEIKHD